MNKLKSALFFSLKLLIFLTWGAYSFYIGARYYETGRVPSLVYKYLGAEKNKLTGGTILVSGTCVLMKNSLKKKGLLRDQLTVFKEKGNLIKGVVRKDKTFVNCDKNKIDIDHMPLLQNIFIHQLIKVSDEDIIFEEKVVKKQKKDWSFLEKKEFLMTASSCTNHKKEPVPNFIEEEVVILKATHINMKNAKLDMIRKKDNLSLICEYENVSVFDKKEKIVKKKEVSSIMNKRVYVSGRCIPHKSNVSSLPVKLNNYILKESPIRVIDEKFVDDKLKMVSGVILEENDPVLSYDIQGKNVKLPIKGHIVECVRSLENPISVIENPILREKEGEQ